MLTPDLRDTVGKAVYEPEKRSLQNLTLGGFVIEWESLSDKQKEIWCKRAEAAIRAFLHEQPSWEGVEPYADSN